jgi:hypothetical protein
VPVRGAAICAATSDGAAQALQARDMLAGNWLLHGWTLSDVSFYPTELAEYVLVELIHPLGTGVIHVAAAATYTLLVLSALLLGWLLLDRAPRRCWGPAALGVLLAVVQFADRVAVLTAVLPLVVVCAASAVRTRRAWRYELALAGAALGSVGLSWAARVGHPRAVRRELPRRHRLGRARVRRGPPDRAGARDRPHPSQPAASTG